MGEQRRFFRFRLPWLSAAPDVPPTVAQPQPRPGAQTQAPSQPTITIPIQRPPFRPAGIAPVQNTQTQVQAPAPPQKTEPRPVPSRGMVQTQQPSLAPTQKRATSMSKTSTSIAQQQEPVVQAVSRQQSPSRLVSQSTSQTPSQPSSPPRRATQVQTISPPKRPAMATQVASKPPSSSQPLPSALKEATFRPFGVALKPPDESTGLKDVAPKTEAAKDTPAEPVKPKEMEERKKVTDEPSVTTKLLAAANDSGTKTRELLEQVKKKTRELLEKDDIERKKTLTTSSIDEKQIKSVSSSSSTYPKDRRNRPSNSREKHVDSKLVQVPLHKEIREDISKFVHKLVTGNPKLCTDEKSVCVVTLAGENSGASFQSGSESTKKDEILGTTAGYGGGGSRGRNFVDSMIEENVAPKAYVNSNTQSINNSIVLEGSLDGRNPGVHLDYFHETSQHFSMAEKSKVLIIGGTGYIGKFIVEASAREGHPTFALVREGSVSDPVKGKLIQNFDNLGVQLLYGDLYDHESLVKAIKQVDVVISSVGHRQLADQVKIIAAIKEAGNVKRFFPSEFGNDVDRAHAVEPAKTAFANKAQIRRAIEAEGIPYTYVSSNCFAGYFLTGLAQPGATTPPREKVVIPGDGYTTAVFNHEGDIGTYTIKAVDDPRTLNKILYIKPPKNCYSFNEIVALWEKLIGKTLEKTYVPEDQLLKQIQEAPIPINVALAIRHSIFVKGDQTNFEIQPSFGVEASELYTDVKYTTVEEYLSRYV